MHLDPSDRRSFSRMVETATEQELRLIFVICREALQQDPVAPDWRWAVREVVAEAQVRKALRSGQL